jgi:CRISPR-associated protein Cas1
MDYLIQNRVETVFITPTGRFRARLMIDEHKHVALRKAQYINLSDPEFGREVMKVIVQGKLRNMIIFLLKRGRDYGEIRLKSAAAAIKSLTVSLSSAQEKSVIRGIEGAGARVYFGVFKHLLRNPEFSFKTRNRRPPLDPVNALLSFVYTQLINEVISAIKVCGLDPYLGTLHEISYGRPSLGCDLVEEYRSLIGDRFVLSLLNRKMIKSDDFLYRHPKQKTFADEKEMVQKRPVEMKPHLYKTFLASYEEMMRGPSSYRGMIRDQVRAFAVYIQEPEKGYQPMKM